MIRIGPIETFGWEAAIRGMRNSYASWDKSDSGWCGKDFKGMDIFVLGPNDKELAEHLAASGGSHSKFRRMIHAQMDISAPLYWWKEFDTYKVGTTANSTSTMHSIMKKEFSVEDFAQGDLMDSLEGMHLIATVNVLNKLREKYLKANEEKWKKLYWSGVIRLLPESYMQLRTIDVNYEVLSRMVNERKNHKLDEWVEFCKKVAEEVPYAKTLILSKRS